MYYLKDFLFCYRVLKRTPPNLLGVVYRNSLKCFWSKENARRQTLVFWVNPFLTNRVGVGIILVEFDLLDVQIPVLALLASRRRCEGCFFHLKSPFGASRFDFGLVSKWSYHNTNDQNLCVKFQSISLEFYLRNDAMTKVWIIQVKNKVIDKDILLSSATKGAAIDVI